MANWSALTSVVSRLLDRVGTWFRFANATPFDLEAEKTGAIQLGMRFFLLLSGLLK